MQAVKVNSLGKWKTALQMASMSVLLVVRQPLQDFAAFLPADIASVCKVLELSELLVCKRVRLHMHEGTIQSFRFTSISMQNVHIYL